jgi:hypothetical protein
MLFGEVLSENIIPECDDDTNFVACHMGRWITFIETVIFLFVTNILIINLLIAVHNDIFDEVSAVSHQVWMFRRIRVLMEHEKKPVLPPPLTVFCHVFLLFKYCYLKVHGIQKSYYSALKLFLDPDAQFCLYKYEQVCRDGYLEGQETESHRSNDECIRIIADEVDSLCQEYNNLTLDIQRVEVSIIKAGDITNQMVSHSAASH